jgi:hypothetical protein
MELQNMSVSLWTTLPAELREQIYAYVLTEPSATNVSAFPSMEIHSMEIHSMEIHSMEIHSMEIHRAHDS